MHLFLLSSAVYSASGICLATATIYGCAYFGIDKALTEVNLFDFVKFFEKFSEASMIYIFQ